MFTYTQNPSTNKVDEVRLLLGDTIEDRHLLEDEEINYALSSSGNKVYVACAKLCDALAVRFAKDAEVRTATYSTDRTSVSDKYKNLASMFRRKGTTASSFRVPSLSEDTKSTYETDDDLVQSAFSRKLHDNVN